MSVRFNIAASIPLAQILVITSSQDSSQVQFPSWAVFHLILSQESDPGCSCWRCALAGAVCWNASLIWIVFLPAITLGMHYVWRRHDPLSEIFFSPSPSLFLNFATLAEKSIRTCSSSGLHTYWPFLFKLETSCVRLYLNIFFLIY